MQTRRKWKDLLLSFLTYLGSAFSIFFLAITLIFVVSRGASLIGWDLITGDYHSRYYAGRPEADVVCVMCEDPGITDGFYSERYGIVLRDDRDRAGNVVIRVAYIDENSPLNEFQDTNRADRTVGLIEGAVVTRVAYFDAPSSLTRNGAERMVNALDEGNPIREMTFSTLGGGIRGSLITTLYLIGFSLLFAMPLGIMSAVYMAEFAPQNKFTNVLRSLIETLTGVPSIIYGLLGITVLIPITVRLNLASGPNLIAGGMTLAIILLPVVIRTTEEALRSIPQNYRHASLALGADYTQTVTKVVLPNALPGILTATFLAIGRIIGESAALIFVLGTVVRDRITVESSGTSLAVHIWSVMTDEPANVELASAIALIILMVVLVLNVGVKLTARSWQKRSIRGVR